MKYFYAYHGPQNKDNFDYSGGYGVQKESKLSKAKEGDLVFVIQRLSGESDFMLCGLFKIARFYYEPTSTYPHRVQLNDISRLDAFLPLDELLLSEQLPPSNRKEPWTNFTRHFCHVGASFEAPLGEGVVSVLNSLMVIPDDQTETIDRREDGMRMVKIRREQGRFRKEVMSNWGGKCAITGSSLAVEACHIVRHADKGSASVENGIALAADFHKLFDSDNLSFRDNQIILSEAARREPRYKDLHGKKLREPLKPVNLSV